MFKVDIKLFNCVARYLFVNCVQIKWSGFLLIRVCKRTQ